MAEVVYNAEAINVVFSPEGKTLPYFIVKASFSAIVKASVSALYTGSLS